MELNGRERAEEGKQQGGVGWVVGGEVTGSRGLIVLPGYLLASPGLLVVASMPRTFPSRAETSSVIGTGLVASPSMCFTLSSMATTSWVLLMAGLRVELGM